MKKDLINITKKMASTQKSFLLFIIECTQKQTKLILQNRTRAQLLAIRECILNLITGRVQISDKELIWLKKHKTFLRKLAYKSVTTCELTKKHKVIKSALNIAKSSISKL